MNVKQLVVKRLPADVFHPSEYINDELEARCWTREQFLVMSGMNAIEADQLLDEQKAVTPRIALMLSKAFGMSASLWYRLQRSFDARPAK